MLKRINSILLGRSSSSTQGGGSGTGTSNYDDLTNKPQINGIALLGNKTGESLGLQNKLTSAQLDAVNSGITAEKIAEYDHNFEDDTVAKYTQGGTPFYEMYSNENPYRKLTVDCYYPRPQTFIITTSSGYYGKLYVVMSGNNLGGAEVRVFTEKGTAPFEIKYGNVQALSGSGHYSVDVFIYKKITSVRVLNIKPYIQGISSFTKVYTADDFVVSTADEFTNATKTATISTEYATINNSSTSSDTTTWSAEKLENLLLTSKNIVNTSGTIVSQSINFNTEYLQALSSFEDGVYFIRNGICHVRFGFRVLKNLTDDTLFELPAGKLTVFSKTIPSKTNPARAIDLQFFYGRVTLLNGLAGDEYSLMFSYPIA